MLHENHPVERRGGGHEKQLPVWRRWTAVGALSLIGTFGVQNYETLDNYAPFFGDGSIVPEVIDCPAMPDEFLDTPPEEATRSVSDVTSSARNYERAGIKPQDTLKTIREFYKYPQTSFISKQSGIVFNFYSDVEDAQWQVNEDAFDELFHFGLREDYTDNNPQIEHISSCLKQRFLEDKEFSGEEYAVYIPNNPRSCLGNGRIIDLDREPEAKCWQRGFAPPYISLSLGPFELFEGHIMILTGGRNGGTEQSGLKRLTAHEAIHAYIALPGEEKFRLDANEKWAKYHERVLLEQFADDFAEIEDPVRFNG